MRDVLISGASAAGPALAYWLRRKGFTVTVVERAPGLRTGGQAVDVRGVALDVMDRMGLGEQLRAARTRMRGMSIVDGEGNELFRSEEYVWSSGRLDSEDVELLRDDLTAMLYEATKDDVEYVFDNSITALRQDKQGVVVELERGGRREFDLVIGADGVHSTVRRLAFGPEQQFSKHLGQYLAIFPMANVLGLDNWQMWFRDEASGAGGAIYPVRDNTELRVTLGFQSEHPVAYDYRDVQQQKQLVTDRLANVGWHTPTLLAAMADAPNFYFDAMAQIHMDHWTTGRVALVGDAGYCASALSGQGTSLALVGAYVLADELGRADATYTSAFAAYEQRMRPYVTLNQALATENPSGPPSEESVENAKHAISLASAEHVFDLRVGSRGGHGTPGITVRQRRSPTGPPVTRRYPPDRAHPRSVGGRPARLADRRRHPLRQPGGRRALVRGAQANVRPGSGRAATTVLLLRDRHIASPSIGGRTRTPVRPLRPRIRRAVPNRRPLLLPRWPRQCRLARRPHRPRSYPRHNGRDRVSRRTASTVVAPQGRRRNRPARPRPRRPDRHGRLLPTNLGPRGTEDKQARGSTNQHPVPPARRPVARWGRSDAVSEGTPSRDGFWRSRRAATRVGRRGLLSRVLFENGLAWQGVGIQPGAS